MKEKQMDEEKLHQRAHEIFDESNETIQQFIQEMISETLENNQTDNDDDKGEYVINPLIAGIAAAVTNYFFYLGYSKGEMLEMMCDFYQQTEIFDAEDEEENAAEDEKEKKLLTN